MSKADGKAHPIINNVIQDVPDKISDVIEAEMPAFKCFKTFRSLILISIILLIQLFQFTCTGIMEQEDIEYFEWRISTPAEQGIDTNVVADVVEYAGELSYIYSFLVMRNGYMVVEKYFNQMDSTDANHIHSVSKSITSALLGIALEKNFLNNLDDKMLSFFPEYRSMVTDSRKFDITLKHLITMRSGFRFDETLEDWTAYAGSSDWISYAINLPLDFDPGTQWDYSTPQTNLLSAIITKSSGMSTKSFAEKYLLNDLGINVANWHQDPQGYYTGGHEIYITPREMMKFGYLYLKKGKFNGKQLVPRNWVETSTAPYPLNSSPIYGYGWWTDEIDNHNVYSARGKGGQLIVIVPHFDLIFVTTTDGEPWTGISGQSSTLYGFCEQIIGACEE